MKNKNAWIILGVIIALTIIINLFIFLPGQNKGEIKIGVILPLTGKISYVGEWVQQGIELAVKNLEKKVRR